MKQGSGHSSNSARKPDTTVHVVDVKGVSQIGQALGNHATDSTRIMHGVSCPMYENKRGFLAPEPASCTPHKAGSQGRS